MSKERKDPLERLLDTGRQVSKEHLKESQARRRDKVARRRRRSAFLALSAVVAVATVGILVATLQDRDRPTPERLALQQSQPEEHEPEVVDEARSPEQPVESESPTTDGTESETPEVTDSDATESDLPPVEAIPPQPPAEEPSAPTAMEKDEGTGEDPEASQERPPGPPEETPAEPRLTTPPAPFAEESGEERERMRRALAARAEALRRSPPRQPEPEPEAELPESASRGVIERVATPLLRIDGGRFEFGALPDDPTAGENETPRVPVRLDTFYLEEHEVTNRQYKRFLEETGYPRLPISDDPQFSAYNWDQESGSYPEGAADLPVVNVSRADAQAYARWLGRRLPTELEWEYAARGGSQTGRYPWGSSTAYRISANFDSSRLLPVQSYQPNGYGLFDMAGNAFEWVSTPYVPSLHENLEESTLSELVEGAGEYGVLRGGAFYSTFREIRWAYREFNLPDVRYPGYGFRCAADEGD